VRLIKVESNEKAEKVGFRGSPTILVDGQDLYGDPIPPEPHLCCRFYPKGLPDLDTLTEMIKALIDE
jgi:protein-disulfide isomerase